jgi:hypothetical protein
MESQIILKRAESSWDECCLGRKGPKPAQVDLHRRTLVLAGFGHFHRNKCHSLLHSSGNKLTLAETLIFIFCMSKYSFYFVSC